MPPAFFGIIHLKDLFAAQLDAQKITSLDAFIRPLLKIPRELSTLDLLRQFRDGESHFGIVYNEHQSPIGFITLDDLLRVMLGRIKDEFHQTPEFWVKNPDGSLTVKGNCPIAVLESALGIPIPVPKDEDEDIDTLNGLILAHLGRLPNKNERVVFSDFDVVINQRRGVRIAKMTVYLKLSKKKRKN
jgi:CBS domain containing-hemolysin-like protein